VEFPGLKDISAQVVTPKDARMPAYDKLSPASLDALLQYLTSLK
jgi:hypothetical protein